MSRSRHLRVVLTACAVLMLVSGAASEASPSGSGSGPVPAAAAAPTPVPVLAALETADAELQAGLESAIEKLGAADLVRDGRMAVALVDLSGSEPRYAGVNGDEMLYAASLPKIAILLGAFDAMRRGALADTPMLGDLMTRMIRVSDNGAATDVLHRVGFESVAATLTAPRLRLYDPAEGGGLWVGKAYGENDYWRRDPLANLSHGATARQVARFFVLLEQGDLVSQRASTRMKAILGDPGIRHKFVRGLDEARPGAEIFRKSGTWRDFHADAALVQRDDATYVAVGLVQSAQGGRLLERLIVPLDDLVREQGDAQALAAH